MNKLSKLLIKEKEIVVPGETLATGMEYLPSVGTYRKNDAILANKLGIAVVDGKVIKIIPVSGAYHPKRNDTIIAKVIDISMSGWRVDTNCAYSAMLSMKDATSDFIRKGEDLTKYFDIGEYMVCQITQVTSQNLVDVTLRGPGLKKLGKGRIIEVSPHKVPRIIGKQGSMVSLIKDHTNTRITVGQNGIVWIQGEPAGEILAIKTIRMIEEQSHISGLTDKIKEYLEKNSLKVEGKKDEKQKSEDDQGEE
ncbi:RNA-binding protein [Candidatus Woesearchaeota archaeon]|mgnify:CR=1 FL=1|nr:MAG: RNA-binding protein [Candidatus Woesearchaeota archaeon]